MPSKSVGTTIATRPRLSRSDSAAVTAQCIAPYGDPEQPPIGRRFGTWKTRSLCSCKVCPLRSRGRTWSISVAASVRACVIWPRAACPWHRDYAEPGSGALRRTADPRVRIRGSHPLHRGRLLRSTDRHWPGRSRLCDRILLARSGSRSLLRAMSPPYSPGRVAPDLRRLPAIVR